MPGVSRSETTSPPPAGEPAAPDTGPEPQPGLTGAAREDDLRLFAIRGATQVEANEREAIVAGTEELIRELIDRNQLSQERMVSCLFTATEDLDAEFPAVAARNLGIQSVPLICAREIPVSGSMPRVIRVLLHYYAPPGHEPAHTYLGEAAALRDDLTSAQ